jgi:DNA-binding CsgD family transcriptional regulator
VTHLHAIAQPGSGLANPLTALYSAADLAEAAARSGRTDVAAAAVERLAAWAEWVPVTWPRAVCLRSQALLADGEEADALFEAAVALEDDCELAFEAARTRLLYGEHLRRRRRPSDAREHLRAALTVFERFGAAAFAERASGELRATGESARRRDPSTLDQLTPQELQIARFVSEGATNREVASRLFLSPRTVEYHLRKVFMKLGISSRGELARMLPDDAAALAVAT